MSSSNYAGEWETDHGHMILQIQGNQVLGKYGPNEGRIQGTVMGNIIRGTWRQKAPGRSGATWGTFVMTFSADGRSFTAQWNYTDDYAPGGGNWYGRRDKRVM